MKEKIELKVEYKGEIFSLEKGKTYLLKIKEDFANKSLLGEMHNHFKKFGINVITIIVPDPNAVIIQEAPEGFPE